MNTEEEFERRDMQLALEVAESLQRRQRPDVRPGKLTEGAPKRKVRPRLLSRQPGDKQSVDGVDML